MKKAILLVAGLAALAACGSGAGGAGGSADRPRERFDATVDYVRESFERQGGALESAFLAEGTSAGGRAGQYVCGVAREGDGERRAFMSPAIEGDGMRELMTTLFENRDQREWYRNACSAPVRDAAGQEIRFAADGAAALPQAPSAGEDPAAPAPAGTEPDGGKDPAADAGAPVAEPMDAAAEGPAGDKDSYR